MAKKDNAGSKKAPITVDNGEEREVKREPEEKVHPAVPVVEPTERNVKRLIKIAGEKQSRIEYLENRVKFLENAIDQKPNVLEEKEIEELKKKLKDATEEYEKKRASDNQQKDGKLIKQLSSK
ncbi:hypothetical protein PMAYCL1PPCAC_26470, partial [Pristionchus mayeri]